MKHRFGVMECLLKNTNEERNYLMEHWQELRQGTYTPLWKQREK